MAGTLAERVWIIENGPDDYITEDCERKTRDKEKEIREEFERLKANRTVREVRAGNTSFLKKYQELIASSSPESLKEEIADLEECIGYGIIETYYQRNVANIHGLGGTMAGLVAGLTMVLRNRQDIEINRRDFMIIPLEIGIPTGLFGYGWGRVTKPIERKSTLELLEQNARHLDEVYSRVYSTTAIHKESSLLVRNYFQRFGIPNRA